MNGWMTAHRMSVRDKLTLLKYRAADILDKKKFGESINFHPVSWIWTSVCAKRSMGEQQDMFSSYVMGGVNIYIMLCL